jgi:mevalonate kinase
MKWDIPAKTFLLGEYAAIAEASAILITTTPYFELSLNHSDELIGIHPESPAGIWWKLKQNTHGGLSFYDPYHRIGGLGASSAQFLGSYLASCSLKNTQPDLNDMLSAYYQSSWSGSGLRPSGYDVIAQSQQGCVYINKKNKIIQSYPWPFQNLSLFLIHTGEKLATHHHLQTTTLPTQVSQLSAIVDQAKHAFDQTNSAQLVNSINEYHHVLTELNLVAQHSLVSINQLKTQHPEILAIKGCGALGADILLIITAKHDAPLLKNKLHSQNWLLLATEENCTPINKSPILSNRL